MSHFFARISKCRHIEPATAAQQTHTRRHAGECLRVWLFFSVWQRYMYLYVQSHVPHWFFLFHGVEELTVSSKTGFKRPTLASRSASVSLK